MLQFVELLFIIFIGWTFFRFLTVIWNKKADKYLAYIILFAIGMLITALMGK